MGRFIGSLFSCHGALALPLTKPCTADIKMTRTAEIDRAILILRVA